jgi:hypothetical protein
MAVKTSPVQPGSIKTSSSAVIGQMTPLGRPIEATGATAGTPGAFKPDGATAPAGLTSMTKIKASPATPWTTGQRVVLADKTEACWSGTNWVGGRVP